MAQQIVNIGTVPNDGTGDTMRDSFSKVDNNFSEVYFSIANVTSNVSNLVTLVNTTDGALLSLTSLSFNTANAAYQFANNQYTAMNAAFTMANTVNSLFYGAAVDAKAAYDFANSTVVKTNAVFFLTNSAYNFANSTYNFANTVNNFTASVRTNTTSAYDQANSAFILAGESFDEANVAFAYVLGAISNTESAYAFANGVSVNATASFRTTNSAYSVVNSAYGTTNSVYFSMNSAYVVANAAFGTANAKVNTVNGIVTGLFTAQGNVYVYGTTTLASGLHIIDSTGAAFSKNLSVKANPAGVSGMYLYDASGTTLYGYSYANGTTFTTGAGVNAQLNFNANNSLAGYFDTSKNLNLNNNLYVIGDIVGLLSDERLKKDIKTINNASDKVNQLRGVTYHYNDVAEHYGFKDKGEQIGLLAQDAEKVIPQVVKPAPFDTVYNSDSNPISQSGQNYKTIQYEKVVPLLVEAIKELTDRVKKLEEK